MAAIAVALGANLPSRHSSVANTLTSALALIAESRGFSVIRTSRWFRSPAFPPGSGPDFVNGATLIESELEPDQILGVLHEIEERLGRERNRRWAPRVCDLDLLFHADLILPDRRTVEDWIEIDRGKAQVVAPPRLILPHPRLHERAFVLVPLMDVAPEWRHPVIGRTIREMTARLQFEELRDVRPLSF